jgi:hypothetical protein
VYLKYIQITLVLARNQMSPGREVTKKLSQLLFRSHIVDWSKTCTEHALLSEKSDNLLQSSEKSFITLRPGAKYQYFLQTK